MLTEPSIIEYNCYRTFLEDYFEFKKKANRYFSYRSFSMRAGFSSPSFLKMIINRQRNLTENSMTKVANGFNFSEEIREVFFILVKYNQLKNEEQREGLEKKITLAREHYFHYQNRITVKDFSDLSFFFEWENVALYVYIGTEDFRLDLEIIQQRFDGRLTISEIKERLIRLEEASLIRPDPEKGFVQTAGIVDLTDRTTEENYSKFYSEMIDQSLYAMNRGNMENFYYSSSTVHISKDKIPELKAKIDKFKKDIVKLANGEYKGNEVFQFNTQVFNLLNMS